MSDDNQQYDAGRDLGSRVIGGFAGFFGGAAAGNYVAQQVSGATDDAYTLATGKKVPAAQVTGTDHTQYHDLAYNATVTPSAQVTIGIWTSKDPASKGKRIWRTSTVRADGLKDAIFEAKGKADDGGVFVAITPRGQVPYWHDSDLPFEGDYNFTPLRDVPQPTR